MRILAISGSLRAGSSNTALLRAAATLAPEGVEVVEYKGLGELPHFNPDIDVEEAPPSVTDFRAQLQASDGVLICSPEYAHGVPGVLKNALDWIVGSGEFMEKPVALIGASPRATYVRAALIETLTVMMARMVMEASIAVHLPGNKIDETGILASEQIRNPLSKAVAAFVQSIQSG